MQPTERHFQASPRLPFGNAPHSPDTGVALSDAPLSLEFSILHNQITHPRYRHELQKTHKIYIRVVLLLLQACTALAAELSVGNTALSSTTEAVMHPPAAASHIPGTALSSLY